MNERDPNRVLWRVRLTLAVAVVFLGGGLAATASDTAGRITGIANMVIMLAYLQWRTL